MYSDDVRSYLFETLPILLVILFFVVVPMHFLNTSEKTVGVVKQASEPLLLHEYDSDDGYKAYYTSDLTVEYPDPDTGEKVSGILKVKEKRAENIPAVGKEVHIYIRELGKSKMLVLAQPEITYYIASGMGVVLLIGFLIFFIVRWPK